jgi:hypothetical protein
MHAQGEAGGDQVRDHGAAHIAKTDEGDCGHRIED